MHFKSLLHVRDHSKATGRTHHLLEHIAQHVNMHTGEAFDLSVERLAYRLDITPQWVRQLRTRLVETGELSVKQSRGRHCNVYIIPYERCPACQGGNPKVELSVEINPDETNPKLEEPFAAVLEPIELRKDSCKEMKERKEGATRKSLEGWLDKPERQSPYWCKAHGFCHSEWLPDHRPDCARER